MEFDEVIKNRRSIRNFEDRNVSIGSILKILEHGLWAPRSGNIQDWEVIIVQKKEIKFAIAEACIGQYWITKAPYVLVFCSKPSKTKITYGKRGELYSIENGSAAIQNILLSAENEGLGSCWVGAFDEEAIKKIVRVPNEFKILAIIPIGYYTEKPAAPKRPNLRRIVSFEKYDNREI